MFRGDGLVLPGGFLSPFLMVAATLPRQIMNPNQIIWIYIILLIVGGLIGFFKGKSQVSLIMSVAFAVLLILTAIRGLLSPSVASGLADVLMAALLVVFAMRLAKTKKFIPSGLMLVITIVALALRHIH